MKTKHLLVAAALTGLVAGCTTSKPADAGKPAASQSKKMGDGCASKSGCSANGCASKDGCQAKKSS